MTTQTIRQQRHLRSPLQSKAERELDPIRGIDVVLAVLACSALLGLFIYQCWECFA